ncbi:hypothetical protein [Amycolatopsis sp. Hca4]|uniref:hypothetical protein n=1 Tax=Amycolatopsis sp. Hca4 TaxID=2742131 RepID=UPI001591186F|nr:hypothetical protein [Amycolatopsis sp. Hca4]QKV77882.1 hypothetical protein HUT10_31910 [Amycolatopsis sp. Hca4]
MTNLGERPDDDTPQELLNRLEAQLPAALPSVLRVGGTDPTAGNDLYEAFLFALVLRAARGEHYQVSFSRRSGESPDTFRLRRSPGRLISGDFTHAVLTLPGTAKSPLEVHTGVAVVGTSKVAHEADVLVIPAEAASRCRSLGIDPPSHHAVLVVEGKYYTTPLSLGMGRQFVGLDADLSRKSVNIMAATVVSQSVSHLLTGRSRLYEFGVLPGRKAEHDLKERFAIALRDYRHKR